MSTKVIAHRGASGYYPENTLISIKKAIELNSDGLEIDVHLTKDNEVVVIHDEKVDRTTNGKGFIKDLTLDEIKALDAGSWYDTKYKNEKVPTLKEVIETIKDFDILLNIELKNGIVNYNGLEEKVVKIIEKYNVETNVIVSSFNHQSLLKVKSLDSDIKIGFLYVASLINPWIYAKNLGGYSVHPYYHSVDYELVKNSLKENIKVIPYTVNDTNHISKLISIGTDYIITNYPDKAVNIRDNINK